MLSEAARSCPLFRTHRQRDSLTLALLGVGWALRMHGLTYHSIWLDEGAAIWIAGLPLRVLIERTMAFREEVSPPLYFLLLKGWMTITGDSDFTLRFFSAWWIMVGLAVLFSIGRIAFGQPVGRLALALGALQPYLVWFSQEVRVYGLLFALSSLATLGLLRALRRNRWSDWLRYGLAVAAACYTHLTALWMIAAHLALTAWEGKRLLRPPRGLLALGIIAAAGWPLALRAWSSQQGTVFWWNPPQPLGDALHLLWTTWTVYQRPPGLSEVLLWICLGAVGIAWMGALSKGLLGPWILALGVGWGLWYLTSWRFPLTSPRYWMSLTPLFLVGLAALIARGGHSAWSRAWRVVALAGWVGLSFLGLRELWSPRSAKEDWRGAAAWISAYVGPGDGALFFAEYIRFPFFHYYRKPLDHRAFAHPIPDRSEAEGTLNTLGLERYETLWYIRAHADWADPQDWVDQMLRSRYPVRMEIFPEKIRIRAYAIRWQRADLPPEARPTAVALPGGWFLRGLQHAGGRGVRPRSWGVFPPTRQLHLVLYWQRASTGGPEVRLRAALMDREGHIRVEALPPRDGLISRQPPSRWPVGPIIVDDRDLFLPEDLLPDRYRLAVWIEGPDVASAPQTVDEIDVLP